MVTRASPDEMALGALPTTELIRQSLEDTKELVRLEVRLAREEVRDDIVQLKAAALLMGVATVLALLALSTLVLALVIGLGASVGAALIVAVILLAATGAIGAIGYGRLPKIPLERTRKRLVSDVEELKAHLTTGMS